MRAEQKSAQPNGAVRFNLRACYKFCLQFHSTQFWIAIIWCALASSSPILSSLQSKQRIDATKPRCSLDEFECRAQCKTGTQATHQAAHLCRSRTSVQCHFQFPLTIRSCQMSAGNCWPMDDDDQASTTAARNINAAPKIHFGRQIRHATRAVSVCAWCLEQPEVAMTWSKVRMILLSQRDGRNDDTAGKKRTDSASESDDKHSASPL